MFKQMYVKLYIPFVCIQVLELNSVQIQSNHNLFWLQCYLTLLSSLGSECAERWQLAGYFGDTKLNELDPTSADADVHFKV